MMDRHTFLRAINEYGDDGVHLIGGEPFMHPDILWMIDKIQLNQIDYLSIITNGSWALPEYKKYFKHLYQDYDDEAEFYYSDELQSNINLYCQMNGEDLRHESFSMQVSLDNFHDRFFGEHSKADVLREVKYFFPNASGYRENSHFVLPIGRGKKIPNMEGEDESWADCNNHNISIMPNGDVSICCSARNIVGNIHYDFNYKELRKKTIKHIGHLPTNADCANCPKYSKFNPLRTRRTK